MRLSKIQEVDTCVNATEQVNAFHNRPLSTYCHFKRLNYLLFNYLVIKVEGRCEMSLRSFHR